MKLLFATLAATTALALPAFAQDASDPATMTCADFAALDAAGQATAIQALQGGMAADAAATDTAAATGTEATTEEAATEGTDMAAAEPTDGAEVSEVEGVEATAAEGTDAAAEDPATTAMLTACQTDPSLLAMDAYMQSQGGN